MCPQTLNVPSLTMEMLTVSTTTIVYHLHLHRRHQAVSQQPAGGLQQIGVESWQSPLRHMKVRLHDVPPFGGNSTKKVEHCIFLDIVEVPLRKTARVAVEGLEDMIEASRKRSTQLAQHWKPPLSEIPV